MRSLRDASPLLRRHYYEEADPDRALAMLEDEMSAAVPHDDGMERRSDAANRSTVGLDTLRALLERECEAQVGGPLPLVCLSEAVEGCEHKNFFPRCSSIVALLEKVPPWGVPELQSMMDLGCLYAAEADGERLSCLKNERLRPSVLCLSDLLRATDSPPHIIPHIACWRAVSERGSNA